MCFLPPRRDIKTEIGGCSVGYFLFSEAQYGDLFLPSKDCMHPGNPESPPSGSRNEIHAEPEHDGRGRKGVQDPVQPGAADKPPHPILGSAGHRKSTLGWLSDLTIWAMHGSNDGCWEVGQEVWHSAGRRWHERLKDVTNPHLSTTFPPTTAICKRFGTLQTCTFRVSGSFQVNWPTF